MDMFFFQVAVWAAALSSVFFLLSLLIKRVWPAKSGAWVLLAVFVLLTVSFGYRCVTTGSSALLTPHGVMVFFAWAMSGSYLVFQIKTETRVLGAFVAPLVFLFLLATETGAGQRLPLPPELNSYLAPIHVIFTLVGEAMLIIAAAASLFYLVQNEAIKKKRINSFTRLLPSLGDLDRINHLGLLSGFSLLTLGILAGLVWANSVLGDNWQGDPKFIWAALVWLSFGVIICQRFFLGWKGHRPAFFSLAAFCLLLASFFVVEFLIPSVHRFI